MKNNPEQELYSLANEVLEDASTSRRDRNLFLIAGLAAEATLGVMKIVGVDIPPAIFGGAALATFMPAGMCEFSRRLSNNQGKDFREGARKIVELDMLTNPEEWESTQEPEP